MNALFYIKLYLLTIPVFFLIDMVWLGYLGRGFYKKQIGFILSDQVNWTAAIAFYLIYIVGILVVAVLPALAQGSIRRAVVWGALFGFFTYATYDLTNLATLEGWPVLITVVDLCWGTFLSATTALAAVWLGRIF